MGLDSYVKEVPKEWVINDFEFKRDKFHVPHEVAYWRKHWDLHDFFRDLYLEKGGTVEDFNCEHVRIEEKDIDKLEKFVVQNAINESFNHTWLTTEEVVDSYTNFIRAAREALAADSALYFWSWY